MSWMKGEPDWMLEFRLKSLKHFEKRPMPTWGGDMSEIYIDDIYYYIKPTSGQVDEWDELPDSIKNTYEKLGIPEAERKFLAGVTAQYESEVVFHRNRGGPRAPGRDLLRHGHRPGEYPEPRQAVLRHDHPRPTTTSSPRSTRRCGRAARSSTCRRASNVEMPLQAYFRINAENMGQFERTLIIADEGRRCTTSRAARRRCTPPTRCTRRWSRSSSSPAARVTYTTIQNWSNNVFNLVTKRARGRGRGPHGVDRRQHRLAPDDEVPGGLHGRAEGVRARCSRWPTPARASTRTPAPRWSTPRRDHLEDRVQVDLQGRRPHHVPRPRPGRRDDAYGCKSHVQCDALILDEDSVSDTFPYMEVGARDADIGHEATVSKVADEQLFYLMSRGLSQEQAMGMIVNGFIEPVTRTLPMEYAVEWSRLIELQMEGSVG